MTKTNQESPKTVNSVLKAIDVIESLASKGEPRSLSAIASECGLPLSTAFRILNTLVFRGYAIRTDNHEYALGTPFFSLPAEAAGGVGSLMNGTIADLAAESGESASVAMRDQTEAVYLAHKGSSKSMRAFTEVGNRVPLYATGVGKCLMAVMSSDDRESLLRSFDYKAFTDNTVTNSEDLLKQILEVNIRGYATDDEEQELGVRCVAVPIEGFTNFAVSVSGPPSRMTDENIEANVLPALRKAAGRLNLALVGKPA